MRCPKCAGDRDKVIDSRTVRDGASIRRRRICLKCGHRFTTYESVAVPVLQVLKRDQRREDFDAEKLKRSIAYAVAKRPVPPQQVEAIADDIRRMPLQLNTPLPDGGRGVSGGQMQRLLVARAVVTRCSGFWSRAPS